MSKQKCLPTASDGLAQGLTRPRCGSRDPGPSVHALTAIEVAAAERLAVLAFQELLTARQAAVRLGMGQGRFFELLTRLRAAGLEVVTVPSRSGASLTKRYTASSINRIIMKAVRTEQPIC